MDLAKLHSPYTWGGSPSARNLPAMALHIRDGDAAIDSPEESQLQSTALLLDPIPCQPIVAAFVLPRLAHLTLTDMLEFEDGR